VWRRFNMDVKPNEFLRHILAGELRIVGGIGGFGGDSCE
jgi:hypothetical protein